MLIKTVQTNQFLQMIKNTIMNGSIKLKNIIYNNSYKTIRCKGFTVNKINYYKSKELVNSLESEIITHLGLEHIIVSDVFNKVSHNTKMFLIAHEQAHIRFGHSGKNRMDDIKVLTNLGVREEEFIADSFAMDILGKDNCIEALREIISLSDISLLYKKELKVRLNVIIKK